MISLSLQVLDGRFAVSRLDPTTPIPAWAWSGTFCGVTRTPHELSIISDECSVPADVRHQAGWACLMLIGPFEFTLTGILAAVLQPLSDAGIGILATSTFDTDYVMVPGDRLDDAVRALIAAGHAVTTDKAPAIS